MIYRTYQYFSSQGSAAFETRVLQQVVRIERLLLRAHLFTTSDAGKHVETAHRIHWYHVLDLKKKKQIMTRIRSRLQIILSSIYIGITYFLTNQPLEWDRGIKFAIVCFMVSLSSESMAYAISSQFSVTVSHHKNRRCISMFFTVKTRYDAKTQENVTPNRYYFDPEFPK